MIEAIIIQHNLITRRQYTTLEEALLKNRGLPGECLGYYDPVTKIMHVEKKGNVEEQEAIIEGIALFKPNGLDVREIRYLE